MKPGLNFSVRAFKRRGLSVRRVFGGTSHQLNAGGGPSCQQWSSRAAVDILIDCMHRRAIAVIASIILLCAGLLSTWAGSSVTGDGDALAVHQVNTDDGVSLDESVIDDLRPSTPADASQFSMLADLLVAGPFWRGDLLRDCRHAQPLGRHLVAHQPPFIEHPLRPPSVDLDLA